MAPCVLLIDPSMSASAAHTGSTPVPPDAIVRFEGEYSFLDLVRAFETGANLRTVRGIAFKDGDEIVQLYLTDSYCRITRPVKELINFKRISLKIGEKKTLKFTVTRKDMSFLNEDLKPEVELGEFVIMAGKNAIEGISTKFNIK